MVRVLFRRWLALPLVVVVLLSACTSGGASTAPTSGDSGGSGGEKPTLVIGAIPDQDPELLARNYELLADYLSTQLDINVEYSPVTEYEAAVSQFRVGDLDLVWFGGLTGVQARLAVDGSNAIAQRDIDAKFTSLFIANTDSGIPELESVSDLVELQNRRFTFGSESSTSGRLMPQHFLNEAGVSLDDFDGEPGFSGNHDATIKLVETGSFEAGAVNKQVWDERVASGEVDTEKVQVIFETPEYFDYHWVAHPDVESIEPGLEARITEVLLALDKSDPDQAQLLEFFGAETFIATQNTNYADIEAVGREIGKIT